jgi:site-specific DNA recombinase
MQQAIRLLTKEIISEEQFALTKKDIEQSLKEKEKQLDLLRGQAEHKHTGEINVEKLQSGLKSLLDVYLHSELSKGEKNELLRGLFDYIMLDFVAKGKFNLTMVFNPKILLHT